VDAGNAASAVADHCSVVVFDNDVRALPKMLMLVNVKVYLAPVDMLETKRIPLPKIYRTYCTNHKGT
jgi:hypothetical protein